MPNWVHAAFNVSGERAELQRFIKRMIRPMAEVGVAAYDDFPSPSRTERPDPDTPDGRKLTLDFNGIIAMPPEAECPNWETWAIEHWGTKWNAHYVDLNVKDPDNVWFQFSTPWDFPTPVFDALADEYPTLVFSGSAYEESGEFELVGEFNGDDSWGPGEIQWVNFGGDEDDDAEPPS